MNPIAKYWNGLSDRKQTGIRYGGILLVLIFTITFVISVVSYLFTWKQDQSALAATDATIQNAAASSGLSLGHLLVTESFGLAAFCILIFLLAWCVKLLWRESPIRLTTPSSEKSVSNRSAILMAGLIPLRSCTLLLSCKGTKKKRIFVSV